MTEAGGQGPGAGGRGPGAGDLPHWAGEMRDLFRSGSAAQFLIHGRLEVAEPSQDAVARLRQGDGILWLALVLKGKVEDCRILGREGRV